MIISGIVFRGIFPYKKIIVCIILFLGGWPIPSNAQFSVKAGKLFIKENSFITVQSDLYNAGKITQEGTLAMNGNWKNKGSYSSEKGTIILSGSGQQNFDHSGQKVNNLTVTNAINVRLPSHLQVEGKLTLDKGIITPDPNTQFVLDQVASIEGGSSDSYINGKLYHTGNGNKFYPIGKNGEYAPVTLTQISGNEPVVGVEFYDRGLNSSPEDPLQWLGDGFYWQLTPLSGNFEGSPISLNIRAEFIPATRENLVFAVSNSLGQGFGTLTEVAFQPQGKWFKVSTPLSVQNPFFTIGLKNTEKNIFYIPNVLSPLATNPEDRTVKIYSEKVDTEGFQWIIRDQWGHVVYTTGSYTEAATEGWQGKVKGGNAALPGIYYYFIKGKFKNGDPFSKKGNLVLIE